MVIIRKFLGMLILFFDKVFSPRSIQRGADLQARVDEASSALALYQFHACPFCVKVRRTIKRLGLKVELRDAQAQGHHREKLLAHGGKVKVPCLRISQDQGTQDTWMYESSDIVAYLEKEFRTFA